MILRRYVALGDSMSIDEYTDVPGGGAVNQFFGMLGDGWTIDDRTCDGCRMQDVPRDVRGEVITLTIGGNDLLWNRQEYAQRGLAAFDTEHLELLRAIRAANRDAVFIVGDIYRPDARLNDGELEVFSAANRIIHSNCHKVSAEIARICEAFHGREKELLCFQIEPNFAGATTIAKLFAAAYEQSASMSDERGAILD